MTGEVVYVWIKSKRGRVKAEMVHRGEPMSIVRYLETFAYPTYAASAGDERRVSNRFISAVPTADGDEEPRSKVVI